MNAQILLVEDDMILRESLVELLEREGYGVSCACCVSEAQAQLDARAVDWRYSTSPLPDGDGVSLCGIGALKGARCQCCF